MSSACSHLSWIRQPVKDRAIHKEECTQCFQTDTAEGGVDVCLHCFNGACTGANSMQHSARHASLCHPIVLNIKRKEIVKAEADVEMTAEPAASATPAEFAAQQKKILDEAAEPKHFYETEVNCLACQVKLDPTQHEPLARCIEAVLASKSVAESTNLGQLEEEIKLDCSHCLSLEQVASPPQLGDRTLTTCGSCDVKDAMWLCLTCGTLGCSRRQMTGAGTWSKGNGHAAAHAASTGHALVVKIGTITAEGAGDCYCYQCDNTVVNPNLIAHLRAFNIIIDADTQATELSTLEQQLEMNLKMNWSLAHDSDGKEAELAFGPGRTGLANLGNSCYLASVLQVLFSMPHFQQRYFSTALQHLATCESAKPHECFQCQMSKLAIGLLSGRYDPQPSEDVLKQITAERLEREARNLAIKENRATEAETKQKEPARKPLQYGVAPHMFKSLVAGKHAEFSTGRQQDSFEYIHFLLDYLKQKENASGAFDPYEPFNFHQEERLECTRCHHVRYTDVKTNHLALPIPLPEPLPPKEEPATSSTTAATQAKEGESLPQPQPQPKKPSKEYPPVSLKSCVTEWSHSQTSEDWMCPHCAQVSSALKSSRMTTFPSVLMVHMRRFVYEGWVPEKLDIEVQFDADQPGHLALDELRAKGLQAGEVELPAEAPAAAAAPGRKVPDAAIVSGLEAMGFGSNACQRAALAVDNSSADAAASWLFAHMEDADVNDPIPSAAPAASASSGANEPSSDDIMNLAAMGFDPPRCKHALKQCGNDAARAVEWLFSHADDDIPMEDSAPSSSPAASKEVVAIDGAPAGYELFAFVTHMGKSTGSGHYIAHVLKDGKWLCFNDHKVSYAPNPIKAAGFAYILFFRRR